MEKYSEEELKAIYELKCAIDTKKESEDYEDKEDLPILETLLNLIEKQQKEIKELEELDLEIYETDTEDVKIAKYEQRAMLDMAKELLGG